MLFPIIYDQCTGPLHWVTECYLPIATVTWNSIHDYSYNHNWGGPKPSSHLQNSLALEDSVCILIVALITAPSLSLKYELLPFTPISSMGESNPFLSHWWVSQQSKGLERFHVGHPPPVCACMFVCVRALPTWNLLISAFIVKYKTTVWIIPAI